MTERTRSPRERMVHQAAQKLRAGGIGVASMRHVAAAAQAPRGSLQHYFPEGKDQLVEEALQWAGGYAAGYVQHYLSDTDHPTASGVLGCIVDYWVTDLQRTQYELGCPIVGAVAGGVSSERTRAAALATLRTWSAPISEGLVLAGVDPAEAEDLTGVILCAVEGAILLARIEQSTRPLELIHTTLGPHFDRIAAKEPHA